MKIKCPLLSQFPHVKHAFFEANPYILTTDKDKAMVDMAGCSLPLITLKQVHGTEVIRVTQPMNEEIEGDGLVTRLKGIALGILTADCGPILLCDPLANVIGACHAGWKGAKAGILQATLKAMEDQGAIRSQIYATLGPTIQQQHYEVGPEFPALFKEPYDLYFRPASRTGHHYFDLPLYICHQLLKEEIAHIHDLSIDTFTGNFSSRRRALSHEGKTTYFSNLSAIAIM